MIAKKILLIDTLHSSFKTKIEKHGFVCTEGYDWNKEKIIAELHQYSGIVIRSRFKIEKGFLSVPHQLKFIARVGAGMENIDVKFAEAIGIKCLHAPEGNRDAVGEFAIGTLLSLFRNLNKADAEVRKGIWLREENRGIELQGKTIGIIGFGNMGSAFAKKLQGFDVNIIAYDKYLSIDRNKFPYVTQVDISGLFNATDILSLHVPLTEETRMMVNDAFINSFSKNIFFINTARGKCLNTADLVKNMQSGKVLGACLDVLEYESTSFEKLDKENLPEAFQYLINSNKVVLSPHIGGWTHESNEKMAEVLVEKILKLY
ncbi:MAG: hydroxyacid dehydrogenase [Bacteroidetes bacterium]|nr:hydroxyacid dehydrogenase [Bacteroidota bacterium]